MNNRSLISMRQHPRKQEKGITLVELMVAMTVGLFMTAGIISLFAGNQQANRASESVALVQENGRFLMEYFTQVLRQAGSLGCQRASMLQAKASDPTWMASQLLTTPDNQPNIKNILNLTATGATASAGCITNQTVLSWLFNYNNVYDYAANGVIVNSPQIEGLEGNGTTLLSSAQSAGLISLLVGTGGILANAFKDQDVLVTRGVSGRAASVKTHANSTSNLVVFNNNGALKDNDLAIVSTCKYATIFQIDTAGTGTDAEISIDCNKSGQCPGKCPGNSDTSDDFQHVFANMVTGTPTEGDAIAAVYPLVTRIFYLADNVQGIPSLYVKENMSPAKQLVSGVYAMQILYGTNSLAPSCDANNDPTISAYQTADAVSEWNYVNAVKISFVLGSPETNHANIVESPMTLPLGAGTFDASDLSSQDSLSSGDEKRLFRTITGTIFLRNKLPCLGADKWEF